MSLDDSKGETFWKKLLMKLGEIIALLAVLLVLCFVYFVYAALVEGFEKTLHLVEICIATVLSPFAPGLRVIAAPVFILGLVGCMCWLLTDFIRWLLDGCPSEAFTGDTTNPGHADYDVYKKRNGRVVEAYVDEQLDFASIAEECHMSKANVKLVLKRSGVKLRKNF